MDISIANLRNLPRFVVSIAPQSYNEKRLSTKDCLEVVSASQVRVRGWYFPHIDRNSVRSGRNGSYVVHETEELGYHLEQWQMYRSGQFLFRMMPWEVPNGEVQDRMRENARRWDSRRDANEVDGFIEFKMLIYSTTEAYVFAARLAQAAHYDTAVDIQVGLRGVRGWALGSNEFGVHLYGAYIAQDDAALYERSIPLDILIGNPLDLALEATKSLFSQFGWLDADTGMIENWQREIFKR